MMYYGPCPACTPTKRDAGCNYVECPQHRAFPVHLRAYPTQIACPQCLHLSPWFPQATTVVVSCPLCHTDYRVKAGTKDFSYRQQTPQKV